MIKQIRLVFWDSSQTARRRINRGGLRIYGSALTAVTSLFLVAFLSAQTPGNHQGQNSVPTNDPALDRYGGFADVRCPAKPAGYFRLEKIGQRWTFCTPENHAFWMRSVFAGDGAVNIDPEVYKTKYNSNSDAYYKHRNQRYLSWGFNTIGEYSSSTGWPVGGYGSRVGTSPQLPFNIFFSTIFSAFRNPSEVGLSEPIKDILIGVPKSTYDTWRAPIIDVFDPRFALAYAKEVAYWNNVVTGGFANVPWLIGLTVEDADDLWGFKSRGDAPAGTNQYPHDAFLVATTRFQYTADQTEFGFKGPWQDAKLYSKFAWIEFLKTKYSNNVAALNASWATNGFYTSFDDAGGYGSGQGVIDEDGRHVAWMGNDSFTLASTKPGVKADLDAFLYEFAKKFASVAVTALRAVDKNHLIFGPVSVNNYGVKARNQVLKGLADGGINVFWFNYQPTNNVANRLVASMTENNQSYDLTGKPALIWYSVTAQRDSAMADKPIINGQPDFTTQEERGRHCESVDIPNFLNAKGSNGDYYVVGYGWWQMLDNYAEGVNWGLVTRRDNAYDGNEATSAHGHDQWGLPVGGESGNYGNCLSAITHANHYSASRLISELSHAAAANVGEAGRTDGRQ